MKWPWSKKQEIYRIEKCNDGTCRQVYYDPDKAFPLHTKNSLTEVEAQVDLLKKLNVTLNAELQKVVSGFFCQIDEINRSHQLLFRVAYMTYSTNPCEMDKWLADRVQFIIEADIKMRNSVIKMRMNLAKGLPIQEINVLVSECLKELILDSKSLSDVTKETIEKTEEWREEE
jgi:hypothetical protein